MFGALVELPLLIIDPAGRRLHGPRHVVLQPPNVRQLHRLHYEILCAFLQTSANIKPGLFSRFKFTGHRGEKCFFFKKKIMLQREKKKRNLPVN